ncbi:MAG: NAD-dependent dehydratase [Micavibrio sp.]|nr:NAD-dependent dehydratase [Micavibrio sp.]|tara:strand:- start:996 stop:1964 length:969 start_codon:yes stop_codon:yes gene_type:complete
MTDYKTACIFGGTGFIGTQIVRELAAHGVRIKVATRVPESAYFLRPCGSVGQVVPFPCDYSDPQSIEQAVSGCDYVVNCIGILFEKKKNSFQRIHSDIPAAIAQACAKEGVERFVHVSALGIEASTSRYASSKFDGEKAVRAAFPQASIVRPSIVFGEDDDFFNKFARMAPIVPFLPLIGGGQTKFQPVYVGDVSDAVMACLMNPSAGADNPQGKTYELGGPDVVTFKDLYEIMFEYTHDPKPLVTLPWAIAKIQGAIFSLMPTPLLTPDQVESLKTDNVVTEDALSLETLGIESTAMSSILPHYLSRYQPGGRFANVKEAS